MKNIEIMKKASELKENDILVTVPVEEKSTGKRGTAGRVDDETIWICGEIADEEDGEILVTDKEFNKEYKILEVIVFDSETDEEERYYTPEEFLAAGSAPQEEAAPREEDLAIKTSTELKKIAKAKGIPNFGNMTKEQLVTCLNDPTRIDEMNQQVRAKLADQAARRAARA